MITLITATLPLTIDRGQIFCLSIRLTRHLIAKGYIQSLTFSPSASSVRHIRDDFSASLRASLKLPEGSLCLRKTFFSSLLISCLHHWYWRGRPCDYVILVLRSRLLIRSFLQTEDRMESFCRRKIMSEHVHATRN